jgi:predicted LPLAT superfamily acyltransferase
MTVSFLLHAVVCYYVLFRPSQRNRARPFLSRRFPGSSALSMLWLTYVLVVNLGKVLIDRAALGIIGPEVINMRFEEDTRLLALLHERKGLILLSAHVGGWQVVMAALRFLNVPINLVVYREEGDVDRYYFEHHGGPAPFRIIDPAEPMSGVLSMMEVLKKGEVLCVMGDRVYGDDRNTVPTLFLNDPIPIPLAIFKVASATGSPIAVLFSHRTGERTYKLTLDRVIRVPGGLGRSRSAFASYTAAFVESMESFVKEHPFQFFNFFDMWERKDDMPARIDDAVREQRQGEEK